MIDPYTISIESKTSNARKKDYSELKHKNQIVRAILYILIGMFILTAVMLL